MNIKTQFLVGMLVVISTASIESASHHYSAYAVGNGGYLAVVGTPASAGATDGVVVGSVVGDHLVNYDRAARFMTFPVRYSSGRTGIEQFATRHYHERLTAEMQRLQTENESLLSAGTRASIEALEQENSKLKTVLGSTLVGTGILAYWLARK